eukprot:g42933.t1
MVGIDDVKEDHLGMKNQQALLFVLEASKIIFWSRIYTVELDETYYKLLSKLIANLDRSALGSVVHPDQTCSVPGRKISETLVLLRNTIAYVQDRGGCELERGDYSRQQSLQVKASLWVDDESIFCLDPLLVHKLRSICDQFKLALEAKVNQDK